MLSLAAIVLALQAQITERDVPLIMAAIAERIASDPSIVASDRPSSPRIVLDAVNGAMKFRELVPAMPQRIPDIDLPYVAYAEGEAVNCVDLNQRACPMAMDGILLYIKDVSIGTDITPAAEPDEYMVSVVITWNRNGVLQQTDRSYGLIKTDGVWQLV